MTDGWSLDGAIDAHVHTAPDLKDRHLTDLELARRAAEAGLRGVVVKHHLAPTTGRVAVANEAVGETVLHGSITLNGSVGGINPAAVEGALALGARVVWLPTGWAANHARETRADAGDRTNVRRVPGPDEEIRVAEGGDVTGETRETIDLVGEHDATLATGHVSPAEIEAVVDACADAGVRVTVTHPFHRHIGLPIEAQADLAERGAVMEYCARTIQLTDGHTAERHAEAIEAVGPENAVLATDYGQPGNPPVEGLARFAREIHDAGIPRTDVETMIAETPARVLGLD